jgi:HD superfamily phosphohydrolase
MAAKIFRDPLYNYISIDRKRDGWLLDLLDCAEVQRLRRIHQLGVSMLTYPGANHNRLSHSLGVVHLMQVALAYLATIRPEARFEDARQPLLAAALVHDIGHAPFSHVMETCLGVTHEDWSCRIIRAPDTEVHRVLARLDPDLPAKVSALIDGNDRDVPPWQRNLLASELDVDRLDYLRRDSLFTGAGYGQFDWFRILHTFTLLDQPGRDVELVWTDKAKFAIEEFIFARFYMYQNVYLHKTTRGFEKMLQALYAHARRLHAAGTTLHLIQPLADFWEAPAPSIRQYLNLEEFVVLVQVQAWTGHPDKALSDLSRRFLNRRRFVAIDAPADAGNLDWQHALEQLAVSHGYLPAAAYVLRDDLDTSAYMIYVPETESAGQQPVSAIRLQLPDTARPVEISQVLPRLQALTAQPARQVRYYVPRELRSEAVALRRSWDP